jgi:hypothetical protein
MLFTLAYLKSKFKKILLNETEVIPTNDTYVNAYVNEDSNVIHTLDNNGNILEFEGEIEQ